MDWTEVCIRVATDRTDEAAAIANMAVPYGLYIEDYSDLEEGAREIAHIDVPGSQPQHHPPVYRSGG